MARTMVEDGYRVKPLALPVVRAQTRPARRAPACGKRALEPICRCELQGVNETSTPPSHSYDQLQPGFLRAVLAPGWGSMRSVIAAVAFAAVLLGAAAAEAEKRVFIIANNADGYGIDRCLASGASCGEAAANSYCHTREFAHALSYRKVDRDDITGGVPATGSCRGAHCDNFVAIECAR